MNNQVLHFILVAQNWHLKVNIFNKMNETATATAANDADRTARTVGTTVATVPEYWFVIGSEREYNTDKLTFE